MDEKCQLTGDIVDLPRELTEIEFGNCSGGEGTKDAGGQEHDGGAAENGGVLEVTFRGINQITPARANSASAKRISVIRAAPEYVFVFGAAPAGS